MSAGSSSAALRAELAERQARIAEVQTEADALPPGEAARMGRLVHLWRLYQQASEACHRLIQAETREWFAGREGEEAAARKE